MSNQRNIVLAVALSMLLLLGWEYAMSWIYPQPAKPVAERSVAQTGSAPATDGEPAPGKRTREGGLQNPADVATEQR